MDTKTQKILGCFCQDSGVIVVVYESELQKYNPDYETDFCFTYNRTIIENFTGDIEYKTVPVTDDYADHTIVIIGTGNVCFRTCDEEISPLKK